jgi:acyl carrier protein
MLFPHACLANGPRGSLSPPREAGNGAPVPGTETKGIALATDDAAEVEATVRAVLRDVLAIEPERVAAFTEATPLFGALPELDSMAVAGLLTELEDRLGIVIEDDEVDGELLESFGSLLNFAWAKALV